MLGWTLCCRHCLLYRWYWRRWDWESLPKVIGWRQGRVSLGRRLQLHLVSHLQRWLSFWTRPCRSAAANWVQRGAAFAFEAVETESFVFCGVDDHQIACRIFLLAGIPLQSPHLYQSRSGSDYRVCSNSFFLVETWINLWPIYIYINNN